VRYRRAANKPRDRKAMRKVDHRGLLVFGLVFGGIGVFGVFIDEWLYGLLHPFDFEGKREVAEPIKRVFFHSCYIAGLVSLIAWGVWVAIDAVVGIF
jgi:hypothetical protein